MGISFTELEQPRRYADCGERLIVYDVGERCVCSRRANGAANLALLTARLRGAGGRCVLSSQPGCRALAIASLHANAHLLCLDARSGHLLWDVAYAGQNKNYGATSAPLVIKNKVLVGTSGGDDGVRGFVAAFDTETGKECWRFWTIPAPGEPGSESWPGEMYLRGGATTWMPGTYDPELNAVYWGTSNAAPDFDGSVRPGDDLYTACVLALDADTGKLKWHFQFTPHDLFDYDATETAVLVDADYKGAKRKLLVEANRNGFLYVLDRTNGEFLSATPFVKKLNWAKRIDAKGRLPMER